VYSKEAIMEYLLTKTQELKRQRALYEVNSSSSSSGSGRNNSRRRRSWSRIIRSSRSGSHISTNRNIGRVVVVVVVVVVVIVVTMASAVLFILGSTVQ